MKKQNWISSLAIVIVMLCRFPPQPIAVGQKAQAVAPGLELVPKSDSAYKDIDLLQRDKILIGYPNNYFKGQRILTRYEFAVALNRVLNQQDCYLNPKPEVGASDPGFVEFVLAIGEFDAIKRLYGEFRSEVHREMLRLDRHSKDYDLLIARLEERTIWVGKVCLRGFPEIDFSAAKYEVDPYLNLARELQILRKDRRIANLNAMARDEHLGKSVYLLCRLLFINKGDAKFRRPSMGAGEFMGGTSEDAWPLEPIEIVDGVPFLITRGYPLAGKPASPESYLNHCLLDCDWNPTSFKSKSREEKQKALQKLLASSKWKTPLTDEEKAFLARQIQ